MAYTKFSAAANERLLIQNGMLQQNVIVTQTLIPCCDVTVMA